MIESILIYTTFVIFSCIIINFQYNKLICCKMRNSSERTTKISMVAIIFISIIFTLYNIYITYNSVSLGGDRLNYTINFNGIRKSSSLGLEFVFEVVRMMSGSINKVFYITTFICVFFTFLAYRMSKDAMPSTIFLLFMSQFIFSTFVNLKQCYTSAFASLFFVIAIHEKGAKDRLLCIILIALACLFHPTGFILIPLYLIIRSKIRGNKKNLIYVLLIIIFVFFEEFMHVASVLVEPFIPSLAFKLKQYLSSDIFTPNDASVFAFIKGLPFYYIVMLGFIKRDRLKTKICNYDKYLIISTVGASLYLASVYQYWLSRTIYLFYMPIFTFFTLIMKNTNYRTNRMIHWFIVGGGSVLFTYRFLALIYINYGGF